MADVLNQGQTDTLTAVYTFSDGSTQPADDAVWTNAVPAVGGLSADTGATVVFTPADLGDGSTTADTVTASGGGFDASLEIDVVASTPAPTITGISISSAVA